jgi:hypothetical protein
MSSENRTHNGEDTLSDSRRASNVITKLTQNDILLGRGAPIINYEGNVRFRALVSTRKKEYNSTGRHQIKDEIARQIVLEVKRRNGRFLRKLDAKGDDQQAGIHDAEPAWTIADEDVILEKVKQALRDKEPEKRITQSQSLDNAAVSVDTPQNARPNSTSSVQGPTSENDRWARHHLPLHQNSLNQQIGLSNILSRSSYPIHPTSGGDISASALARRQAEYDPDILRRQQQRLLSNLTSTSVPRPPSFEYLQALLQQNQSTLLSTLSTRPDQGAPSNDTLISILRTDLNRYNDTSRIFPTMRANQQHFDETLHDLLLNRHNRTEAAIGSTVPNYSSLDLTNTSAFSSLRAVQQYTAAATVRREQQRHDLQRQILLDPRISAAYLAASRVPLQINNLSASVSQSGGRVLATSLPIGQSPPNSHQHTASGNTAGARMAYKSSDSTLNEGESEDAVVSAERSNADSRKRNVIGDTESAMKGRKKKTRVDTNLRKR